MNVCEWMRQVNTRLEHLIMWGNSIEDDGCRWLGLALAVRGTCPFYMIPAPFT
jgi:hypothetical protein